MSLGDREERRHAIKELTGIDEDALCRDRPSHFLSQYSVAQKMSWASARQTTRTEDLAYCLLGLFGVNMPLLYGEGSKAFRRLQEEIIQRSDDNSIFAWTSNSENDLDGSCLASSPACFRYAGDIIPFRRSAKSVPFFLNNRGLEISLLKYETGGRESVFALDCGKNGHAWGVGIKLVILDGAIGLWARASTGFEDLPFEAPSTRQAMLVNTQPIPYSGREFPYSTPLDISIRLDELLVSTSIGYEYRLTEVYPLHRWCPEDRSLGMERLNSRSTSSGLSPSSGAWEFRAALRLGAKFGSKVINMLIRFSWLGTGYIVFSSSKKHSLAQLIATTDFDSETIREVAISPTKDRPTKQLHRFQPVTNTPGPIFEVSFDLPATAIEDAASARVSKRNALQRLDDWKVRVVNANKSVSEVPSAKLEPVQNLDRIVGQHPEVLLQNALVRSAEDFRSWEEEEHQSWSDESEESADL